MEINTVLEAAAVSDRGLSEKRPQNEDSYLALPSHGIFAVADGVGGAQAGDVASQMAVEILGEAFANRMDGDAEEIMKVAIERANAAIFQMANDLPQLSSMATTIVAVHVSGDVATIGHVGDSRLYRFDPRGNIFRETNDHSIVEEEVRAGRITPAEALNHPNRNIISRALGAEGTVQIDLKTIIAEPGTSFLLCSDGITRHIDDSELREIFAARRSPDDICYRLKEICYDRGAEDNLTAVVVRVAGADAEQSFSGEVTTEIDEEELTVATSRSPFEDTVSDEEFPRMGTGGDAAGSSVPDVGPVADDDDSYLMIQPEEETTEDAVRDRPSAAKSAEPTSPRGFESVDSGPLPSETGSFPRVLSAAALLLIGALLGAGGYYYLLQPQPEPLPVAEAPVITEMKSNNTALTAFEEGRRQVDSDPAKYLAARASTPQEAEDYFLLGRAYLLTGKYWEAKRAFNEARTRLPQVQPENAKTLAAEIAMALAVIGSQQATESFEKNAAATDRPTNENSNTFPTPGPPQR